MTTHIHYTQMSPTAQITFLLNTPILFALYALFLSCILMTLFFLIFMSNRNIVCSVYHREMCLSLKSNAFCSVFKKKSKTKLKG